MPPKPVLPKAAKPALQKICIADDSQVPATKALCGGWLGEAVQSFFASTVTYGRIAQITCEKCLVQWFEILRGAEMEMFHWTNGIRFKKSSEEAIYRPLAQSEIADDFSITLCGLDINHSVGWQVDVLAPAGINVELVDVKDLNCIVTCPTCLVVADRWLEEGRPEITREWVRGVLK